MKLDQLIGYFNGKKINLIPPFQRGHVWKLPARQRLLENIVQGRPIPAIFLYKEADGSQFTYNILDGKQRLESLLLFIGSKRPDLKVDNVRDYFFSQKERDNANFPISIGGKKQSFAQLSEEIVRELREYAIPTIEIDLDENSALDEVINLFVDINQYGEKVRRFQIVKAIGQENALLSSIFDLIAMKQKRREDFVYKKKTSAFTRVLQSLQMVSAVDDVNQRVDRMWERLVEIVLYLRTGKHRAPGQIIKSFIRNPDSQEKKKLSKEELKKLRVCFDFLDKAYKKTELGATRLGRDVPHFYTMITCLLTSDLLKTENEAPDFEGVREKLLKFSRLLTGPKPKDKELAEDLEAYKEAAASQTTHPGQRSTRETKFLAILSRL
jgi:hypothetical protein